ncbi:polysaccharide deacetylase family protein [Trichothermofontia sp.]
MSHPAARSGGAFQGRSQAPKPHSHRPTPTRQHRLGILISQLHSYYAAQGITLYSQSLLPDCLQIQLLGQSGLSPRAAQQVGQQVCRALQQQQTVLLANQIRQVLVSVTTHRGSPPLWQRTIALLPLASASIRAQRVASAAPPILKLGQWLGKGCLDFFRSNGLLLTFLLAGWLYAALALNPSPQSTQPQTPQPTAQPVEIPRPARSDLTPVEVAATPNPLTFAVPEVFQGKTIYRINPIRARKLIALTFNGGPWPDNTEQILAILKRYHVKATFFWTGQTVVDHPDLARQVVAQGHAIGNQPWSRPEPVSQRLAIAQAITRTTQAIQQTTGVTSGLLRPSQLPISEAFLLQAQRQQYTTILWSLDASHEDSSDAIVDRVLQEASSGTIVRMQEEGDRVALIQALPQIITLLRRQGYQFLTVPDLLKQQTNLQTRPI